MVRQLKNRPIRTPDPFGRPGTYIVVQNPLSVIAGCSRAHCPICNHLKAQLEAGDRTLPLTRSEVTGFEVVH